MTIREPMTMATDYLLALVAWSAGARLLIEGRGAGRRCVLLWGAGLLMTGLAAVVGGSVHGFAFYLSPVAKAGLWQCIYLLVGAASFLVLTGALRAFVPEPPRRGLVVANGVKLAFYVVWMAAWPSFRYAIYDYLVAMLAVLVLLLWRRDSPGARDGVAGILVGFGAAALQQARVSLHEHFNHNDLYHVVQCGSLWLLARAGRSLRDLG